MPNYSGISQAGGIYSTPSGPSAGFDMVDPQYNSILNAGWVSPSSDPNTYYDFASGTYKKRPTAATAIGLPAGPSGPGGSVMPSGTQVTTGTQTGVQVPYSNKVINPNDPSQRYSGISVPKLPDEIAQEGALQKEITAGTDALKPFSAHLSEAAASLPGIFNKAQASFDPSQTINTLNSRQTAFDTSTNQAMSDYRGLNAQTAANEKDILAQEQAQIPVYDQNAQDAARQQLGMLQGQVSRYKMGSGTPTSMGSAEQEIMGAGAAKILVPMETAKIAAQFGVYRDSMASALDIANREQTRIGQFNPMIAQQQLQTGQLTANTIQQLRTIAQQMDQQSATQFLTALGMAPEMQQRLLAGQLAAQGAMAQFQTGNRYLGLQDVLGATPTQPQFYGTNIGRYPNQGRYTPAMGPQGQPQGSQSGSGGASGNALMPGENSNTYYDPTTGIYYDRSTGNPIDYQSAGAGAGNAPNQGTGTGGVTRLQMPNYPSGAPQFDPLTGLPIPYPGEGTVGYYQPGTLDGIPQYNPGGNNPDNTYPYWQGNQLVNSQERGLGNWMTQ